MISPGASLLLVPIGGAKRSLERKKQKIFPSIITKRKPGPHTKSQRDQWGPAQSPVVCPPALDLLLGSLSDAPIRAATTPGSLGRNDPISEKMHMTTLLNRMDVTPDELALIPSEPISTQWTSELRKNIGLHPSCQLLRELLSLDRSSRTVLYPFLIKGWSTRRIADRLKVSLNTIHELLEIGREHLKSRLTASC